LQLSFSNQHVWPGNSYLAISRAGHAQALGKEDLEIRILLREAEAARREAPQEALKENLDESPNGKPTLRAKPGSRMMISWDSLQKLTLRPGKPS